MASRHPPPLDGLDLLVKGGVLTRWYEDLLYVISSFLSHEEGGVTKEIGCWCGGYVSGFVRPVYPTEFRSQF